METNSQYNNIDNYLAGRLSDDDSKIFESKLQSDPSLQSEVAFQRQIIDGVKHYRKMQLKSHLQAIDVSPGIGSALQSAPAKMVYSIVTAGVIGVAAYFGLQPEVEESKAMEEPQQIAAIVEEAIVPIEKVPDTPINVEESTEKEKIQTRVNSKPIEITPIVEEKKSDSFTPSITLPDNDDFEVDEEFSTEVVTSDDFENPGITAATNVDVNVIQNSSDQLMYVLFDGKLSLIGNFSKSPYEILEVNSKVGKTLFLFYNDKYYALELTSEQQLLVALKDKENIEQLNILRNHK